MASGNEDICYHNFLCSQPSKLWGLPLTAVNNMFSNIAFFLLGLLVILITYRRWVISRFSFNCVYMYVTHYNYRALLLNKINIRKKIFVLILYKKYKS